MGKRRLINIACGFLLAVLLAVPLADFAFAGDQLKAFIGEWRTRSPERCGKPDDRVSDETGSDKLVIYQDGETFSFGSGDCKVAGVEKHGKSDFSVQAICNIEGWLERVDYRFHLLKNKLVIGSEGYESNYFRCPAKKVELIPESTAPSFDCRRAKTLDELEICSSRRLSTLEFFATKGYEAVVVGDRRAEAKIAGKELLRARRSCWSDFDSGKSSRIEPHCVEKVLLRAIKTYENLGSPGHVPSWLNAPSGGPVPLAEGDACSFTTISDVRTRLIMNPLSDFSTGTVIEFGNGGYQVSYSKEPAILRSNLGDGVTMCLVRVPKNCPPGDDRGRDYRTTNEVTGESWVLANSQHECGGAVPIQDPIFESPQEEITKSPQEEITKSPQEEATKSGDTNDSSVSAKRKKMVEGIEGMPGLAGLAELTSRLLTAPDDTNDSSVIDKSSKIKGFQTLYMFYRMARGCQEAGFEFSEANIRFFEQLLKKLESDSGLDKNDMAIAWENSNKELGWMDLLNQTSMHRMCSEDISSLKFFLLQRMQPPTGEKPF